MMADRLAPPRPGSYVPQPGDWERQRVVELRSRPVPVPWQHVAAQVGRNEITLRRLYEDSLRPPPPPPVVVENSAPTPPGTRKPRSGKDPQAPPNQALVLMTKGAMTVPEIAERMEWLPVIAKAVMGGLVRGGFAEVAVQMHPFSTWRITDAGWGKLARMTVPVLRPKRRRGAA